MARGDQNNVAGVSSTDWRRRTKPRPRQSGRCPYRGGVVCPRLNKSSSSPIWRVPMARIEEIVSAHLGPGRVRGNESGACFSRQVSMYLGRHVGVLEYHQNRSFLQWAAPHDRSPRRSRKSSGFEELTNLWTRCLDVLADELGREVKPHHPGEKRQTWREVLVNSVLERIADQAKSQTMLCARCLSLLGQPLEISAKPVSKLAGDQVTIPLQLS